MADDKNTEEQQKEATISINIQATKVTEFSPYKKYNFETDDPDNGHFLFDVANSGLPDYTRFVPEDSAKSWKALNDEIMMMNPTFTIYHTNNCHLDEYSWSNGVMGLSSGSHNKASIYFTRFHMDSQRSSDATIGTIKIVKSDMNEALSKLTTVRYNYGDTDKYYDARFYMFIDRAVWSKNNTWAIYPDLNDTFKDINIDYVNNKPGLFNKTVLDDKYGLRIGEGYQAKTFFGETAPPSEWYHASLDWEKEKDMKSLSNEYKNHITRYAPLGMPIIGQCSVGTAVYLIGIYPTFDSTTYFRWNTFNIYLIDTKKDMSDIYIWELEHSREVKLDGDEMIENSIELQYLMDANGQYIQDYDSVSINAMSYDSIIGLPFKFLPNVDCRPVSKGTPLDFGTEYMENIIYDMPIAVLRPGAPTMSKSLNTLVEKIIGTAYALMTDKVGLGEATKSAIINLLQKQTYHRLYQFNSDYATYIEYVNTLCHLFATMLGIGDWEYPNFQTDSGAQFSRNYINYDDTYTKMQAGKGSSLTQLFGSNPAVYLYYQPNSGLSQSVSNTTQQSNLIQTAQGFSDTVKEIRFISGTDLSFGQGEWETFSGTLNNLMEGVEVIVGGANLYAPEYYDDSSFEGSFDINVKLISPYGDPESIFLYVLRPLARIMALSFPRQFTSNGYCSPFIVQAFSKGQFNCQLGIIESVSITRGGNGGESHTVFNVPTELNVNIKIKDMYSQIILSNEYVNNGFLKAITQSTEAWGLLINNIGLIDFVAAYSGFNINSPQTDFQLNLLLNILKNRSGDNISYDGGVWRFPAWNRRLNDLFSNGVARSSSMVSNH